MTLTEAHAAVRLDDQKPTPYRVGIKMGEAYRDAMKACRLGDPRPIEPACPYVYRGSVSGWVDGFRRGLNSKPKQ